MLSLDYFPCSTILHLEIKPCRQLNLARAAKSEQSAQLISNRRETRPEARAVSDGARRMKVRPTDQA
jgi:hypothetical protein